METVGLWDYLENHGIKQVWLARRIGMTPDRLCKRKTGVHGWNEQDKARVAEVLGRPLDSLIFLPIGLTDDKKGRDDGRKGERCKSNR